MEIKTFKPLEKPPAGAFLGRIIDFYTKENVPSTFNGVTKMTNRVGFVWVLGNQDGSALLNKENLPFLMYDEHNASLNNKPGKESSLYKRLGQLLGQVPLIQGASGSDELERLMLNRAAFLFLVKAPNQKDPNDPYTNISGTAPANPAQEAAAPRAPANYVRIKDRVQTTQSQQQQYNPPATAAPVAAPAPVSFAQPAQPAPVPSNQPTPF